VGIYESEKAPITKNVANNRIVFLALAKFQNSRTFALAFEEPINIIYADY